MKKIQQLSPEIRLTIAVLLAVVFLAIVSTGTSAMPTFQSSILPTPAALTIRGYFPLVMRGHPNQDAPEPITPCDYDDPARGPLYRTLVTNTTALLYPLMTWSLTACNCGLGTARANGAAVGQIAGKVFRIIRTTFGIIGAAITSAVSLIVDIVSLVLGDAESPTLVCTGDVELLCFGIATIAALDSMANGIITTMVILVLAFLTFYLGVYVVREVREIMQPTGGDE